jgi:hypothetical protein
MVIDAYCMRLEDCLSCNQRTAVAAEPILLCQSRAIDQMDRTIHVYEFVLIGALLLVLPDPALANWWIVRASDGKCLVVDIEPTGNDKTVTKVGMDAYQTQEQAEADVKRLCKEPKVEDQPPRDPGNAR